MKNRGILPGDSKVLNASLNKKTFNMQNIKPREIEENIEENNKGKSIKYFKCNHKNIYKQKKHRIKRRDLAFACETLEDKRKLKEEIITLQAELDNIMCEDYRKNYDEVLTLSMRLDRVINNYLKLSYCIKE